MRFEQNFFNILISIKKAEAGINKNFLNFFKKALDKNLLSLYNNAQGGESALSDGVYIYMRKK